MSAENLQKFLDQITADPALQAKVGVAIAPAENGDPAETLAQIAAEQGIPVSAEEFREYASTRSPDELNMSQLDSVAGGWSLMPKPERIEPV
jgi:predicted ribosomally synthesized peptide with nif11-like leader